MQLIRSMNRSEKATGKADKDALWTDLPNPFTTAEALSLGIPRVTLHRLAKRGEITPIARGLYERRTGTAFDFDLSCEHSIGGEIHGLYLAQVCQLESTQLNEHLLILLAIRKKTKLN